MVESIKKLREICQKPVRLNTLYQKHVARKLSIYITWLFIKLKITGNQASLLMIIVGIIGSSLFIFGSYWYYLTAVLTLQFWFILDHVDGELARYWKKTSAKGIFIDKLNHHLIHPLIFLCLGIGMYKQFNNALMLILGSFTAYSLLLQDLINMDKKDSIGDKKIKKDVKSENKQNTQKFLFQKVSLIIYKVPGIMNIITIAAILNILKYIFIFYAFTFPIMILLKILYNLSLSEDKFAT